MMRFLAVLVFTTALVAGRATQASAVESVTILDTLAPATPATTFSVFGPSLRISHENLIGPRFTLEQPTLITEIGGFVNNCDFIDEGLPLCMTPNAELPFLVQIRPAVNGVPDTSRVLGTFELTHDHQRLVYSYESASPRLVLAAGTYFALFAPQDLFDGGSLLSSATDPFIYTPPLLTLGLFDPFTMGSFAFLAPAAVRILGVPLPTSADACRNDEWQAFAMFKNQGDCIAWVQTGERNAPG